RNPSPSGGSIATVSDSGWSESTVTYNNRPTIDGPVLSTLGAVSQNQWYELDVTDAIAGNGTVSFGIWSGSTNGADYASREDGAFAPQLVVTFNSSSGPTPTPTSAPATATATSTPTPAPVLDTPTPTATPWLTNTPTPSDTPTAVPTVVETLTFAPVADARVNAKYPGDNSGSDLFLMVDASPVQESFLKFELTNLNGQVTSARLRLYVRNPSPSGGSIATVSDSGWSESTVTYNNRPTIDGPVLSTLGAVSQDQWYELDVTDAIAGNGTVSFGIWSSSTNGADYASREDGAFPPQLVVTFSSSSGSTPTPTSVPATATPTPTSVPATATPTPTPTAAGQAVITLRAISTATTTPTASPSSLTVSRPPGVQNGDILIAHLALRGGKSSVVPVPAGWTLVGFGHSDSTIWSGVYYRVVPVAQNEPASYTWSWSPAGAAAIGIAAYSGVSSTNPIDGSSKQVNTVSGSTAVTAPSITTTANNDRLLFFAAVSGGNSVTPPSGMTERWDHRSNSGTANATGEFADKALGAAGATGSQTGTAGFASPNVGHLVTLRPGTS
ncbi:MAG: DNRLRE domain-containing protein, partial [Chloroflexi bacterium]|nr:DNRLRE domain-containing protein [Chloroflexota bacterium]